MLDMLIGATRELKLGDPRDIATHVGPVIDADAKAKLESWIAGMERAGRVRFAPGQCVAGRAASMSLRRSSSSIAPSISIKRFSARCSMSCAGTPTSWSALLDDIAMNGTALTLGVHSRIDLTVERIAARLPHGNVYVNRNMIGAVVGTQPFGGTHLSGTGPKAGGPNYLRRLAAEQVVTVNTAAAGGNAGLLAQDD